MALDNPIPYYLQAAENQNRNRQQMYQDIAGIGQGLGQGFNTIGQAMQEQKKQQLLKQIVQAMRQKGQPIAGPQGYTPPNQGPGSTAIPAGQPSPGNPQLLQSLMMQYDPQSMIKSQIEQQDPYKRALTGQAVSETIKNLRPPKEQMEWSPFPGVAGGQPLEINKITGEVRPIKGVKGYQPPQAMTGSGGSRGAFYESAAQSRLQHILDPSLASPTSVLGRSAQSSVRVLNGLDLLENPNPTDLNALVGDVDSLVSQASATVEGRKMMQTANLPLEVSKFKAYISTHPNEVQIPDGIKQTYKKILQNLGQFAQARVNNYIDRNAKMAKGIGIQTFGGEQAYNDYVKSIKDDYDINARLKQAGQGSTLGVDDTGSEWTPDLEARYQELLKRSQQ